MDVKNTKNKKNGFNIIDEIAESRNGGQIALKGFSYQFLYSCYLILLLENDQVSYRLEGIEDVDQITIEGVSVKNTHIQLKYSECIWNAYDLYSVLKNFLEIYLYDKERKFKLVYDFKVRTGNLQKIINNEMDEKSNKYWKKKIEEIKEDNPEWDWSNFSYEQFIKALSFEYIEKNSLCEKIEKLLVKNYNISVNNLELYGNGIKVFCLSKMEARESINKFEIEKVIANIQDNISKGVHSSAHHWMHRVEFKSDENEVDGKSFFEGKKPSFSDIINKLPVKRTRLEKLVKDSINSNRVTILKSSSGQGKTTLAMQVIYELRGEYSIYKLEKCDENTSIAVFGEYFSLKIRAGEKILIYIDNLDEHFSYWNLLVQYLQDNIKYHCKVLITTREDDWYYNKGDLSNIKSFETIDLELDKREAEDIYIALSKVGMIHSSIASWREAYEEVEHRKLLIEYVYLLTHGEQLKDRINSQIQKISRGEDGRFKCELLRKICFADMCGAKISTEKLLQHLDCTSNHDYGEILNSMESEFLISVCNNNTYIEGLHPVRSTHVVNKMHEYISLVDTALDVLNIVEDIYRKKVFAYFPKISFANKKCYHKLVNTIFDKKDLSCSLDAIEGVLTGTALGYYNSNKCMYEEANANGMLFLYELAINPFAIRLNKSIMDNLLETFQRENPSFYNKFNDIIKRTKRPEIIYSDIYYLANELFLRLKEIDLTDETLDLNFFSIVSFWLIRIHNQFDLSSQKLLEMVWEKRDKYPVTTISKLMLTSFIGKREMYLDFVEHNLTSILQYLKKETKSLKVRISEDKKNIDVIYILLPHERNNANDHSVWRLDIIFAMLPIFHQYCTDTIQANIGLHRNDYVDDSVKKIPFDTLKLQFYQDLTKIWCKAIYYNFKSRSIYQWLETQIKIRKNIVECFTVASNILIKKIKNKNFEKIMWNFSKLASSYASYITRVDDYPNLNNDMNMESNFNQYNKEIFADFFSHNLNTMNCFEKGLCRDEDSLRLMMLNLRSAISKLKSVQEGYYNLHLENKILIDECNDISNLERKVYREFLEVLTYYINNAQNDHVDKGAIKKWYNNFLEDQMYDAKCALNLDDKYSVIYPNDIYFKKYATCYPIIVEGINKDNVSELMSMCKSFGRIEYDYLIILLSNGNGVIQEYGYILDKKNIDEIDSNSSFMSYYYVDNDMIIDCFDKTYSIANNTGQNSDKLKVMDLLWGISILKILKNNYSDIDPVNSLEKEYITRVETLLCQIQSKGLLEVYQDVENRYRKVLAGDVLLDDELNYIYGL